MPTYKLNILVEGRDKASGPLRSFGGTLKNVATIAGGIIAARVFTRIASGIASIAGEAVRAASSFQQLDIRFRGLLARETAQINSIDTLIDQYGEQIGLTDFQADRLRVLRTEYDRLSQIKSDLIEQGKTELGTYDFVVNRLAMIGGQINKLVPTQTELGHKLREAARGGIDMGEAFGMAGGMAEDLLDWIKRIAVTTPFEVEHLADTLAFAQSFGIATDKAKTLTLAIGNFAAGMGLGNQHMQRIIMNFGQMIQQGKVTSRELMDLARGAMVPVNDVLKDMHERLGNGTPFDSFVKQVKSGKVPVEEFFQSFVTLANEDFPGAMERMSKTTQGVMSNIKDFINATLGGDLLGPIMGTIAADLAGGLDMLMSDDVRNGISKLGSGLMLAFDIAKEALGPLLPELAELGSALGLSVPSAHELALGMVKLAQRFRTFIQETAIPFVQWLTINLPPAIQKAKAAIQPLITFIQGNLVPMLATAWEHIKVGVKALIQIFQSDMGQGFIGFLKTQLKVLLTVIVGTFSLVVGVVSAFLQLLTGNWRGAWNTILDVLNGILDSALASVGETRDSFLETWRNIKDMAITILTVLGDRIGEKLTGIKNDMVAKGKGLIEGLKSGISSKVSGLLSWLEDQLEKVMSLVDRIFNFGSPSKEMEKRGAWMMEGLAGGIENSMGSVVSALQGLGGVAAGGGGRTNITIQVNGARSPMNTARAVERRLARQGVFGGRGR